MPDQQFFKDVLTCIEIIVDDSDKEFEEHIPDEDERDRLEMSMNKFVGTMRAMRTNGTSQRWKPEFVTLMRHAHSACLMPISKSTKECIRKRKFRCAICGQLEKHADTVIHLAGSPVEDVEDCEPFDARDWETSHMGTLGETFGDFYRGYLDVQETKGTANDTEFPAPPYLGVVVPGEECLKHITRMFNAQTILLDTCYEAYNIQANRTCCKVGDTATPERIQILQTRWDELVGLGAVRIWSSEIYWDRLLTRFGKFSHVSGDSFDNIDFLQKAYDRLEMSLSAAKLAEAYCSTQKRKRASVVEDDDSEEDEREELVTVSRKWFDGASSSVQHAHRRNLRPRKAGGVCDADAELDEGVEDEEDVVPDMAKSKKPSGAGKERAVDPEPSWTRLKCTTPSAASTAQSLRAPVLEARVKVLNKLAALGYVLVDRPHFQKESIDVFNSCAAFQKLLIGETSSRFARPSADDVRDVLKNLNKLQAKLLLRGESDEVDDRYAESAIVSAALLTLMELRSFGL